MTVIRWIVAGLIFVLVGLAAVSSMRPRPVPPTRVQTTKVSKATITRTVSGAGKLQPVSKVNVSSNITGVLTDLKVGIGSEVKKGQYLGQIDTSRYAAALSREKAQTNVSVAEVNRAKANLEKVKRDLQRIEELAERGAMGRSEVEQARSAVRVAEADLSAAQSRSQMAGASLKDAQTQVNWATLLAPVDGTVLAVNHRVGERIRGSDFSEDVILVLGSLHQIDVRIEVGEHDVVYVKPGQEAKIEIDALPDLELKGKVIDTGRDAIVKNAGTDNEVTTFPVWVTLESPPEQALSGMSAQVTISTETRRDVLAVPIQSVTVRPGGGPEGPVAKKDDKAPPPPAPPAPPPGGAPGLGGKLEKVVFVVKDGQAVKRKVTTGLSSDALVEIVAGLDEGEEVVEGPYRILARELHDGAQIEAQPSGPPGGPPGGQAPAGTAGRASR